MRAQLQVAESVNKEAEAVAAAREQLLARLAAEQAQLQQQLVKGKQDTEGLQLNIERLQTELKLATDGRHQLQQQLQQSEVARDECDTRVVKTSAVVSRLGFVGIDRSI